MIRIIRAETPSGPAQIGKATSRPGRESSERFAPLQAPRALYMGSRALMCVPRALNRHDPDHDPDRSNVLSGPGVLSVSGYCPEYVP